MKKQHTEYLVRPFLTMSHNTMDDIYTASESVISFLIDYMHYSNIVLSYFKWKSEKTEIVNSEFIEKLLFYKGTCALVEHKDLGPMFVNYSVDKGNYGYFFNPSEIEARDIGNNDKSLGKFKSDKFVIINNNPMRFPTNPIIWKYALDICNIDEAANINTNSQKFPVLISGTKEQKITIEEMIAKVENDEPYIYVPKEYSTADLTTLKINAPFIAKELMDVRDRKRAHLLTLLGMNNANVNKQSGVTVDEINANNQELLLTFNSLYDSRIKAIDEIKKKFDIDITLEVNEALKIPENINSSFNLNESEEGAE